MSLLVVAKKEFTDHITSRRFIVVFAVMFLFSVVSFYQGTEQFMKSYQHFIADNAPKPSIVMIFRFFGSTGITFFGAILGLFMGFDLITRERETGSLKTLLSHPVFRDQIINGKALGAFMALCLVVTVTLTVALGILIMRGFVPTFDDILAVVKFGLITLAYMFTFFSIALFTSTVAKNSGTSLLMAFGIFILLSVLMPLLGSLVAQMIVGEPPPPPMPVKSSEKVVIKIDENNPEWREWKRIREEYWNKKRAIEDFFSILSPTSNYMALVSLLSERPIFQSRDVTKNVVSFVLLPIIFFVASYVKFLRMEVV